MRTLTKSLISRRHHRSRTATLISPKIDALARLRDSPQRQPAFQRKVDALRAIEAQVEARMVSSWIRDHELALTLHEEVRPAGRECEEIR